MSNDTTNAQPITLTPSDLLGVIQRNLRELDAYLAQAPMGVNVGMCKEHLGRAFMFLDSFEQMQAAILKQHGGQGKELTN